MYELQIAEEIQGLMRTEHADDDIEISDINMEMHDASDGPRCRFLTTDDTDTEAYYLVTVSRVPKTDYYNEFFREVT